MIEYRLNEYGILEEVQNENNNLENIELNNESPIENLMEDNSALPVKKGFWTKFKDFMFQPINVKDFLFQEIDLYKEVNLINLELTPYESRVLNQVKDFWTQDVTNTFKF